MCYLTKTKIENYLFVEKLYTQIARVKRTRDLKRKEKEKSPAFRGNEEKRNIQMGVSEKSQKEAKSGVFVAQVVTEVRTWHTGRLPLKRVFVVR